MKSYPCNSGLMVAVTTTRTTDIYVYVKSMQEIKLQKSSKIKWYLSFNFIIQKLFVEPTQSTFSAVIVQIQQIQNVPAVTTTFPVIQFCLTILMFKMWCQLTLHLELPAFPVSWHEVTWCLMTSIKQHQSCLPSD